MVRGTKQPCDRRTPMTPSRPDDSTDPQLKPNEFSFGKAFEHPPLRVIAALLPVCAIGVVYSQARNLGFVWDDALLSLAGVYRTCDVGTIFTSAANTFEYLPVRDLTLCLDHALFGTWAGGFHLQNVLLFVIATVLLGYFYRALFESAPNPRLSRNARMYSLISVMVFAMHPLQVEPVAFVTARNALLALVFTLATLVSYARWVRSGQRVWYATSLALVAVALLSKATALPIALLVGLLDFYLARQRRFGQSVIRALPHLAITAAVGIVHVVIASTHGAMSSPPTIGELITRLPRAAFIPQFYFYKFVWPLNQSTEYVLTGVREQKVLVALGALAFALAVGAILFRGSRTRSAAAFACAGYLAALIPVLNLFPTYPSVADRYAQIPLVFLTPLVLLPALTRLPERIVPVASIVLVAMLGCLSFVQVPVWQSDETVFAHAVEVNPNAIVSLENLAHTHWYRGNENASLEAFEKLEALRPTDGQYALFRAWHAVRRHDIDVAQELLGTARRKSVAPYYVHMVQAEIYISRDNRAAATRELERAKTDATHRFQRDSRARVYLTSIEAALARLQARRS